MSDRSAQPDPLFLNFQLALAGRYSIDRELGRGGMGVVYLAREVHLDRLVAIKLLPPELSARPALRERFLREARLAAKLSHPNIIPIHAVDQTGEFVYYVMAYVDGETLAQRVHARGPLSPTDGIRLLREVSWALGYAHQQGLVHRDVKPDNILIESATGRALVADFGIAAATGDALGESICGTPEFMSPEHALGREVDARSDLYSLGATAFYALSGRLPIDGNTTTEVLARQVSLAPRQLDAVGVTVPRKLAQLIDRCLAKDPAARPASAELLAEQLGVAIEQRRELPAALRAFVKRNGRMDGGGTVLALLATLTTSVVVSSVTGPLTGVALLVGGMALAPVVFGIAAAKRLLDQGFNHADLAPAFRAEREMSREERSVSRSRWRSAAEWMMGRAARVSASTGAVLFVATLAVRSPSAARALASLTMSVFGISATALLGYVALMQTRRDVDVEFWGTAWTGRLGAAAFAIARRLRGTKRAAPAMTHRATELSLGIAVEQLFESLPKASRQSLGDLPGVLVRLQTDAQRLREHYDSLQDALQRAGSAASTEEYATVRLQRDALHERLRTTVGALETIRLSLLRLHAGSLSLEGLTTHIAMAIDVSEDVERLVAAREEVEAVLRFPHAVELTPV
jgi:serine/threonine-protein kinase